MTPRDIEKLKAIGYDFREYPWGTIWLPPIGTKFPDWSQEYGIVEGKRLPESGEGAKAHAQSSVGMKATMADKVLLIGDCHLWRFSKKWECTSTKTNPCSRGATGLPENLYDSPEAAVDALFWKVP